MNLIQLYNKLISHAEQELSDETVRVVCKDLLSPKFTEEEKKRLEAERQQVSKILEDQGKFYYCHI